MSDVDLRQHFDKYGEIEDAAVVRKDGVSRGFGFVTFRDEMSVEKCLVEAQVLPNGRRVDIRRAVPREQIGTGYTVPYLYPVMRGHGNMPYRPYAQHIDYGNHVGHYGLYGYMAGQGVAAGYLTGSYAEHLHRGLGYARPPYE